MVQVIVVLLFLCLQVSMSSSGIQVRATTDYEWKWDDRGSGADKDGSFWKPITSSGESFISYVNTVGNTAPIGEVSYVITSAPEGVLKEPVGAEWIWSDAGSGGDIDISWYVLIPPDGYTCFGDYIVTKWVTPWEGYKCIRNDYVNTVTATIDGVWDDRGSGADKDGKAYRINVNGYPYKYYKMTHGWFDTLSGPFYTFNTETQIPQPTPITIDFVKTYAPILKFDRAASSYGYPMNAQLYINNGQNGNENNILNTVSNPTYYRAVQCDVYSIKIVYWWFYGDQKDCILDQGGHNGDWERIIVEITNNQITKVTYHQHGGHYTLNVFDIYCEGNHPIVYVGKIAHGSYYDSNDFGGSCGYFYDYRNPSSVNDWLRT
eukprot:734450_1